MVRHYILHTIKWCDTISGRCVFYKRSPSGALSGGLPDLEAVLLDLLRRLRAVTCRVVVPPRWARGLRAGTH